MSPLSVVYSLRVRLCYRFTGDELVVGERSPDADEIAETRWEKFATLNFNYRTEGEVFVICRTRSGLTTESR